MIFLLILQLQIWWVFFSRHELTDWTFFGFMYYLLIPIIASMLCHLLLPDVKPDTDIEGLYFHNRKWFFSLISIVAMISLTENLFLYGIVEFDMNFWFRVIFIILSGLGLLIKSKRIQLPLALSFLFVFIIYVGLIFIRLG